MGKQSSIINQKSLIRTFHTSFYCKITFVNLQHENTTLKGNFTQTHFKMFDLKVFGTQK